MERFSPEHEIWLRSVDPEYKAKAAREAERKTKPVAPVEPEFFVSLQQVQSALATVAASIAPLIPRIAALEKKLLKLEAKQNGVTIAAQGVSIDGLGEMAAVVARLNRTLSLPIEPVYNSQGILTGARRVHDLDS